MRCVALNLVAELCWMGRAERLSASLLAVAYVEVNKCDCSAECPTKKRGCLSETKCPTALGVAEYLAMYIYIYICMYLCIYMYVCI